MSHKPYYVKAGLLWLANLPSAHAREFAFDGRAYRYFRHLYNVTWLNERRVEIPIMREVLREHGGGRVLEVGNVLPRYDASLVHTVVDKYETPTREGMYAEDAETFALGAPYDLILSISTLEHVGWDEQPRDPGKIGRTLAHLKSLLASGGRLVFTAPMGYSPPLTQWIDEHRDAVRIRGLRRINARNEWEEADWPDIRDLAFHAPYPFANGLAVVTVTR